jgi:YrbI family 3-deoxy-D-manno-octulosonate 8-phosphate phosphatase
MVPVLAKRFGIDIVYAGAKDKLAAVKKISEEYGIPVKGFVYIGDGDRDAPALEAVGLGVAPPDGSKKARDAAHYITDSIGGTGVLLEVVNKLITGKLRYPNEDVK